MLGKYQRNLFFFKVKELSGNSVICQGKMKCCKNVRERILHFGLMKLECLVPDIQLTLVISTPLISILSLMSN